MDKKVIEDLCAAFDIDKLVLFFRKINSKFTPSDEDFSEWDDENFTEISNLGRIKFSEVEALSLFSLKSTFGLTEKSSKKRQFDKAKKILKDCMTDAGIFVFYDESGNFRMSLIFQEFSGPKAEFSNYKRYTYYVSPELTNKTFIIQMHSADFSSLESIKEAFSVEKVTKQFYDEIASWYFWSLEKVTFPSDYKFHGNNEKDKEIRNAQNIIRLITRIIFVWFLKEKDLVSNNLFNPDVIKNTIKDFNKTDKSCNYYNAILQNLFFGTLNRKMDERKFIKNGSFSENRSEYGVKNLYRYNDKFLISEESALNLFSEIPFLNGGLFDCLDKEDENGKVVYIDGFSRNPKKTAQIPDFLFFNKEEKKVDLSKYGIGKDKQVRGLFDILNNYNFVTDENTPIDQEIALDPELLGKVFENLLASFNPETSTTARKETGSYYTPREIVDFMVDESLTEYLKTKLPEINEDKIKLLISYSDEKIELKKEEKETLINSIDSIKIIDPACGSGAFPMGILHKLVHMLQKIDHDNKLWQDLQYKKALRETENTFKTENDKSEREEQLKVINEVFDLNINSPDYARKLYLIENCIYGVDIQPIAVQIAKLRFFISLIVDEEKDDTRKNRGILALPNLETKFVAANTLIPLEQEHIFYTKEVEEIEDKLKDVRHRYFNAKTRTEKKRLREKDIKLRNDLKKYFMKFGTSADFADKVAEYDIFDQNVSADWFHPEWMFGVRKGFDIAIGNPPYIKEYVNREAFNGLRNLNYYMGKMDIWYLFACKCIDLLKSGGVLTFIAQNNWVTSHGAKKMRNKVIKETKIIKLIDFGSYFVFSGSSIQTMIMIFKKINPETSYTFDYRRLKGNDLNIKDIEKILKKTNNLNAEYIYPKIYPKDLLNKKLTFADTIVGKMLDKIQSKSNFNLDKNTEVTQGVVMPQDRLNKKNQKKLGDDFSVGDGIFVVDNIEKNNLNLMEKEKNLFKPYYTSVQLKKWYPACKNYEWIIYITSKNAKLEQIKQYPNIKKHLDQFANIITSDNKPYGLHRARKESFFKGEKIIAVRKCKKPTFTYTDFDCYVSATFYIVKSERINLKYLTALLNSKLIAFWLKHKGKMQGGNYQIDKEPLLELPLKNISAKESEPFIYLVDKIIAAKKNDPIADVEQFEQKIDQLVYQLYDLTNEEIKVIEEQLSF